MVVSLALLGGQGESTPSVWLSTNEKLYPAATHFKGLGKYTMEQNVRSNIFTPMAMKEALEQMVLNMMGADLNITTITVTKAELGKGEKEVLSNKTVMKSVAEIPGLDKSSPKVFTIDGKKVVHVIVWAEKSKTMEFYRKRIRIAIADAEELKKDAEDCRRKNEDIKANEAYGKLKDKIETIEAYRNLSVRLGMNVSDADLSKLSELKESARDRTLVERKALSLQIDNKVKEAENEIKNAKKAQKNKQRGHYEAALSIIIGIDTLQKQLQKYNGVTEDELQTNKVNRLRDEVEEWIKNDTYTKDATQHNNHVTEFESIKKRIDSCATAKKRREVKKKHMPLAKARAGVIEKNEKRLVEKHGDVIRNDLKPIESLMEDINSTYDKLKYCPTNFILGYRYSPTAPVGISVGVCWWVGGYAQFRGNMLWEGNLLEQKWIKESMVKNTYEGEGEPLYFRRSYTGGIMFRLRMRKWSVYPYAGYGYGKCSVVYVVERESKTYHSFGFIKGWKEFECGAAITNDNLGRFGLSAGYSTILGSPFSEAHGGVVFKLFKNN